MAYLILHDINNKQAVDLSKFYYQLMRKGIALKGVLKFTVKQLRHVSV